MRRRTGMVVLSWFAVALCAVLLGLTGWVRTRPGIDIELNLVAGLAALSWAATGAVLVSARPVQPLGWLLVLVGGLQAASVAGNAYGHYGVAVAAPQWPLARWVAWATSMVWLPSLVLQATVLLSLYPRGTLPARWWRWPVGAVSVGLAALTLGATMSAGAYDDIAPGASPLVLPTGWWSTLGGLVCAALVIGGTAVIWAGTVVRLVRAGYPERQQLAWLVCVVVPLVLVAFFSSSSVLLLFAFLVPVAVAVGVLRYGLLGIMLRRALVYAALTAAVAAVYLTVVVLLGASLGTPLPGVLTAAVVAVGVSPVRYRLQAGVDRLVYGDRKDPLRAVTRLGDRLATADDRDLLGSVLETVTAAFRVPGGQIRNAEGRVLVASDAGGGTAAALLPLRVSGRTVGQLRLAAPADGEPFTAADRRLLSALAPLLAVVVLAVELAESLELERDRVLTATRVERDRLRRDLHDGLGPSLTGMGLGLQALDDTVRVGDQATATALVARLAEEVSSAVAEVRRIVDGLRPAVLDDDGLAQAVRRHAVTVSRTVPVQVTTGPLPALPPEVETAAYRIAQEALTNVARHSRASSATVTLAERDGSLVLVVTDDGLGLDAGNGDGAGHGLASMRRRAEELGGSLRVEGAGSGTNLVATLPLGAR